MTFYDRGVKRDGPPIPGGHRPITTAEGDAEFDRRMAERRFTDSRTAQKPLGRSMARPEPYTGGLGSSSLLANPGSPGRSRGHGAGQRWQA